MHTDDAPAGPGTRRDAARTRARILAAAAQAFAAHGCDADVREIAGRAGVGMGSLYRHFATKQALLDEVLADDLEAWARAAQAAAGGANAWSGLREFMVDALTRHVAHRGLRERFAGPPDDAPDLDACRRRMHPIIADLVARARAEGSLRADVTPDDIGLLLVGLGRITEVTADPAPGAWVRQLDLVLDGLRAPAPAPR
ncbi:TetR/AcrR family transcriptional regulator [Pseudonocardia nantongensis]|uniref:TetR/AcrR family transcriptional regulator n=1 Tax=Pseudonocardia nantongensis TaxID=1181885 RepID=UPI00397B3BF2